MGATVFALGDPGSGLRVTAGNVSAPVLTVRSRQGRAMELVEHTAPLPRGTGGGPLVDPDGSVVGLNALRGDAGFLLALPARAVQDAVDRIVEGREPARLGVALASPSAGRRMRRAVGLADHDGLLVQAVEEGGAAEGAGVKRGDLLVSLGGVDIKTIDDLHTTLAANAGEDAVELSVLRATERAALSVDLRGRER
jgi:serine protease Do